MTGLGWAVLSLSLLTALAALAVTWHATRYRGMHCAWRPLEDPAPEGTRSSLPASGAVPVARQLGHADAMHAVTGLYLPPAPLTERTWPVTPTEDAPSWDVPTGSFPAVAGDPCAVEPYPGEPYPGEPYPGEPHPDEPYAAVPYEDLPVWDSSPQAAQRLLSALRGEHPYPACGEAPVATVQAQELTERMMP